MDLLFNFSFLIGALILLSVLFIILKLYHVRFSKIVIGGVGLFVGLIFSALTNIFSSQLPSPYNDYVSFGLLFLFGFGGMYLFLVNEDTIYGFWEKFGNFTSAISKFSESEKAKKVFFGGSIVLDTSVAIDGRIEDLLKTGFLQEKILVPRYVIEELHKLSDSSDDLKRERGRRGLDILEKMQKERKKSVEIIDDDYEGIKEVDKKLVKTAKARNASLMTVDYNLNKVAKIEGVNVLNINELANALRMAVVPGEELEIKIVAQGKSKNQGVGYLPDGTMIVVMEGDKYINKKLNVIVTKSFQTEAGRMIFADIKK